MLFNSPLRTRLSWSLLILGLVCAVRSAMGFRIEQEPVGKQIAVFQDQRLLESSGIAKSRANAACFWTHNDSGDGPYLFLVDAKGITVARVQLMGAEANDWEDIALLHDETGDWLIVGDIGNAKPRSHLTLYFVREPLVNLITPYQEIQKPFDSKMEVAIPGGTTNYESLAVDHHDKTFILIEKALFGGRMYSIPVPDDLRSESLFKVEANLIGKIPVPLATSCDLSNDSRKLVVISYQVGFLFPRKMEKNGKMEAWSKAIAREPLSFSLGRLRQTEAVCFAHDDEHVVVTSEFLPTPLVEIALPVP